MSLLAVAIIICVPGYAAIFVILYYMTVVYRDIKAAMHSRSVDMSRPRSAIQTERCAIYARADAYRCSAQKDAKRQMITNIMRDCGVNDETMNTHIARALVSLITATLKDGPS